MTKDDLKSADEVVEQAVRELRFERSPTAAQLVKVWNRLLAEEDARVYAERPIREALWINHGCPFPALYGDDGQMQCHQCRLDFKGQPLYELHAFLVGAGRLHVGAIPTSGGA